MTTKFLTGKELSRLGTLLLMAASAFILPACGDDDTAPSNQIKMDGMTIKLTEADVESELNIDDELGAYSYHTFYLTSEGLSMDENGSLSGSGDMIVFGLVSETTTELEEGTYTLGLHTEIGDVEFFEVYSDLTESSLDTYYAAYRGTIKVTKTGEDKYTLAFNFDVFTSQKETEEEEFVDGKIQGNYKGVVELITGDTPAKLPSGRALKGKKTFSWL